MKKNLLSMILMTIMLRVWWGGNFLINEGTGIMIGSSSGMLEVRLDNGKIKRIDSGLITKSEWVEVTVEK